MYERSVIVLERYMNDILGLNKQNNLKNNFYTYKEMVEEMKVYQAMLAEEEKVLRGFEEIATKVQNLQREEELLYKNNVTLEEARYSAFRDLQTEPDELNQKIARMEAQIEKNNQDLKIIREKYVKTFDVFLEKQRERNACARKKKNTDTNHMLTVKKTKQLFGMIDTEDLKKMKSFVDGDKRLIKEQVLGIMKDNGRNEKVPFNDEVLKEAIDVRMDIADIEAKCYIVVYDKLRKILSDIENDMMPLSRFEKTLKDTTVKLKFLEAEKEYIVGFLDNERVTAINGESAHKKMMQDACSEFSDDIMQINNLFTLIKKETMSKGTNKAYAELYNANYLRQIEEGGKNFEKELTNININTGTILNSDYWRIEGLKNVYKVFKEQVEKNYSRDLSPFEPEEEKVEPLTMETTTPIIEKPLFQDFTKFERPEIDLGDLSKYEDEEEIEDPVEEQIEKIAEPNFDPEIVEYDEEEEEPENEDIFGIEENDDIFGIEDEEFEEEEEEDFFDEEPLKIKEEEPEGYDDEYEEYTKGFEDEYNKKMQEIEEAKKKRKSNVQLSRPKAARSANATQASKPEVEEPIYPTKQIRDIKVKIKNRKPSNQSINAIASAKNNTMSNKGLKIKKPTVTNASSQSQRIDEFMHNTKPEKNKTSTILSKIFNKNKKIEKTQAKI